ncbi:MAG: AMP-binding protein [Acidimicrobiales bacterium]
MADGTKAAEATVAEHVARRSGDANRALVFEGRDWTWSQTVAQAAARASLLRLLRTETSVAQGPFHVGVLLDNVPEFVFVLLGAALGGATVVGLNSTRRGEALATDIAHTDCAVVLTDTEHQGLLRDLEIAAPVVTVEGASYVESLARASEAALPELLPGPEALYLLLFTAGSTGAPKAVRMTQGRAARTAAAAARVFSPDDVLYCAMPLFHGNALVANLLPALIAGAAVVLKRRFSASEFGPDVRGHGCTYFNYVGRALSYVLAVPETPEDGDNQLRWALGSEASPRDRAEFARRFRCPVFEGYGSSENAVVISPNPGAPPGALGRPAKGMDVAIVHPDTKAECPPAVLDGAGRLLNPAEAVGEIVGRSTRADFEGYYNNPEAEAERTRNGWYWTGDLGYRDAEGYIYFAGRAADWLRVDGENFSAGAVDQILQRYPAARGVAVYGVPDPVTGDQVMAAIEMADPDSFDPADFAEFLAAQADLGPKWVPRFLRVVEALPVTGAGKLDKAPLRAEAWEAGNAVWWRPGKELVFEPFTPSLGEDLRGRFEAAGRAHVAPMAPAGRLSRRPNGSPGEGAAAGASR